MPGPPTREPAPLGSSQVTDASMLSNIAAIATGLPSGLTPKTDTNLDTRLSPVDCRTDSDRQPAPELACPRWHTGRCRPTSEPTAPDSSAVRSGGNADDGTHKISRAIHVGNVVLTLGHTRERE